MPLLASVAVMLCTGMVLVVWSVMGGFLSHLVNSGRSLIGDVSVEVPYTGFAHYEELQKRLEAMPQVEATAPVIVTQGLLVLPTGQKELVLIRGIEGQSFAKVSSYRDAIWWKPVAEPLRKDRAKEDPRLEPKAAGFYQEVQSNALSLTVPVEGGKRDPAAVVGIEVGGFNLRKESGIYVPRHQHGWRMPRFAGDSPNPTPIIMPGSGKVTLHVLPMDSSGRVLDAVSRSFPVANEFHTGVYEVDRKSVFIELSALQSMLMMDKGLRVDKPAPPGTVIRDANGKESFPTPKVLGEDPARVTTIYIRAKGDSVNAEVLKDEVQSVVAKFENDFPDAARGSMFYVSTWRDANRTMISAVEKETGMVLILFSLISVTAVFLVLAIFWSMVAEKTKDMGILRALGASRSGVAWVWIRYGLAIGVVGSIGGFILAYLVVNNINEIHDWLGKVFHVYVWDPKVYYFNEIPARLRWFDAGVVVIAGVVSSGLGALIPAIRAARMDPVRAIRFE